MFNGCGMWHIKQKVKYCPKCAEDLKKKVKMDYIPIDPGYGNYKPWAVFMCPVCHYEEAV